MLKDMERLGKEEYADGNGQRTPVAVKGDAENCGTWSWSRIVDR